MILLPMSAPPSGRHAGLVIRCWVRNTWTPQRKAAAAAASPNAAMVQVDRSACVMLTVIHVSFYETDPTAGQFHSHVLPGHRSVVVSTFS